jgi:hypothetical protein
MRRADPKITALLLARGMVDLHERIASGQCVVQQDASMPLRLRRGLALLSGMCVSAGVDDLGASVHVALRQACQPFSDWGLDGFRPPFPYADVALIDGELAIPTADCREMAVLGGSELAAQEDMAHEALRSAVQAFPQRQRDATYTAIREFVVRRPVCSYAEREHFVVGRSLVAAAQAIYSFYRPIPAGSLFDGVARQCGHCGSLLWPDRDQAAWPDGRCRIRQCRLAHPHAAVGAEIAKPVEWQWAGGAVLAYWIGPGLDEIRIYDALRAVGRNVVLFPMTDAADVGVDGAAVGIDVKSYASPVVLAAKLSKSIGRLAAFTRRVLAVPDDKLDLNPNYLQQLRDAYHGDHRLEFMTASQAIRALA